MPLEPFINKNYWSQEAFFSRGHREVQVCLTITMNGPLMVRTMSCWLTAEPSGDVLEATVPFYRGPLDDLPGFLVAVEDCMIEVETYVAPF